MQKLKLNCLLVIMWFLFGKVSSSSCCLGWTVLFYCGTPSWAFYIIILKKNVLIGLLELKSVQVEKGTLWKISHYLRKSSRTCPEA